MKLKNKFAVVVGGVVGIGAAISKKLANEGCNIIATYHGEKERKAAQKLGDELANNKIKYFYENLDVLSKNQIVDFFKKVKSITSNLDIAINNAGVSSKNNFIDLEEKDWDFVMDINAKGMFFCCQEEAKIMIKQNKGKIINMASLAGKIGVPLFAHYSASKFAVLGLTFTMAMELANYNINVNAVCPGAVLTDMTRKEWNYEKKITGCKIEDIIESAKKKVPLGRFAMPEDVANMVVFLALDESNYITGQAFNIDGGRENH